ncbi:MAG: TetR/AcrR family transcriptional regulator [Alphaproteobacteria bacterium]|nr:TetR/AcrR family transcriptional regulator [Alphaproteobacteria bacterium]
MMVMQKNNKAEVRELLLQTGRKLVADWGAEFLTARKLSEASGCSVGTIYNQFGNMDNFVMEQNIITINELSGVLQQLLDGSDFYRRLNRYVEVYVDWISKHKNLWLLLYDFHLRNDNVNLPKEYKRIFLKICKKPEQDFDVMFRRLSAKERRAARLVLLTAVFSTSSFLLRQTTGKISKKNVCKLLVNTYLAGLEVLKRVR